jgi:hypothetical protein
VGGGGDEGKQNPDKVSKTGRPILGKRPKIFRIFYEGGKFFRNRLPHAYFWGWGVKIRNFQSSFKLEIFNLLSN